MSDLLTKKQVAKLIGVSERTVSRHDEEWGLNPIKVTDRLVQYRTADVQAYLNRIGKTETIITPLEAEQTVRQLLEAHHFDEGTTQKLQRIADLLASLK